MPGKPLGERVSKTEALLVAHTETCERYWESVDEHLETLNGDVAENSKFRVQQKAVYWVIGGAFTLAMVPLTTIAIAVLA